MSDDRHVDRLVADAVKTLVMRGRGQPTLPEIVRESALPSQMVQKSLDRLGKQGARVIRHHVVVRGRRYTSPRPIALAGPISVEFWAIGDPATQGSKSYKGLRKDGTPILVESSAGLPRWRADVTASASAAATRAGVRFPEGPVALDIVFYLRRPKRLRWSKPATKHRNDIDKLERAVLDALTTSRLIGDDGQVTEVSKRKEYANEKDGVCGVFVTVTSQYAVGGFSTRSADSHSSKADRGIH